MRYFICEYDAGLERYGQKGHLPQIFRCVDFKLHAIFMTKHHLQFLNQRRSNYKCFDQIPSLSLIKNLPKLAVGWQSCEWKQAETRPEHFMCFFPAAYQESRTMYAT